MHPLPSLACGHLLGRLCGSALPLAGHLLEGWKEWFEGEMQRMALGVGAREVLGAGEGRKHEVN